MNSSGVHLTHLKLAAKVSSLRCHHQRVSARCSAAFAVTRAWNLAIWLSTKLVSSTAGGGLSGLPKPKGTLEGSSVPIAARMALRLACLQTHPPSEHVATHKLLHVLFCATTCTQCAATAPLTVHRFSALQPDASC